MELEDDNPSNHDHTTTTVSNQSPIENDSVNNNNLAKEASEPNNQQPKGDESSVTVPESEDPKPEAVVVPDRNLEPVVVEPDTGLKDEDGGEDAVGDEIATVDVTDGGGGGGGDGDDKCEEDVIVRDNELKEVEEDINNVENDKNEGEEEKVMTDVKSNDDDVENEENDDRVKGDEAITVGPDDEEENKGEGNAVEEEKEEEEEEEQVVGEEDKAVETDMESDEEKGEAESPEEPVKTRGGRGRKRKRGGKTPQATPKSTSGGKKTVEEEDVCFMCYDGGALVICDKRNCPKAYHPACINRDEAFFQTKGKWECGWHLCNECSKKAEYMCYTCTFSLCKSCIKTNVILCVREKEKKGFCESCMNMVMLIENKSQENQGSIDFNDENSWEYMFKDYWMDMKAKLDLSLSDLVEAKNAYKGSKPAGKQELPTGHSDDDSGSENPYENLESQTRKTRNRKSKKPNTETDGDSGSESPENLESQTRKTRSRKSKKPKTDGDSGSESPSENLESQTRKTRNRKSKKPKTHGSAASASDGTQWASKELLEFVAHMGHDTSYQSQFDVQALLLEYIKTNKLRDSRRKSQIICDARLQGLFGKPRVGHFEMLKLLESHFLIKDDDDMQGSVVDTDFSPMDDEKTKDKKRKNRKKGDQEPQSNREDYAAIDNHNINLIYLKRKLAEDLLDDTESFHSKIVGTFVRIRISGANLNHDIYRLVQVTGTTTGASYTVGKKTTDIMLEILNLDKTEAVSIDTISNQEFTEDECKRLRQSIKCGLINRLTVGDILDKAIELQPTRVNDWLETEVVRLSHLRDRASDLGRKKELRECVEKLEVLKKPEERARRLQDIPVIHDDPTMDPKYESEDDTHEDDKKQDMYNRSEDSRFIKRRDYPSKETWRGTGTSTSRNPGKGYEFSRNLSSRDFSKRVEDPATSPRMGLHNDNIRDQGRDRAVQTPPSALKKPSSANETEKIVGSTKDDTSETEKIWHYKDPTGKIQGPFSMAQLRKWNNNKFFPADLRIWRTSEKEKDGILLTDALEGRFTIPTERHGFANLPSPTPKQSAGHVAPPVGSSLHQEGLQSPTPNGSQLAASLVAGQNAYSWSGGQPQPQQPNQWVVPNPAGNLIQQPPQPIVSWLTMPPNPNIGLVGPTIGNQPMNWGTVNVNPSLGLQAGPGNVNPGWVPPQPVLPSQVWVPGPAQAPIVSGTGIPGEVALAGNSNQGWGSPRPRNESDPYNRSRGGGSGFNSNRRHWEKQGSFNRGR